MTKLLATPTGRVIFHTIVILRAMNHFTKPNTKFYLSAVIRYAKGIG